MDLNLGVDSRDLETRFKDHLRNRQPSPYQKCNSQSNAINSSKSDSFFKPLFRRKSQHQYENTLGNESHQLNPIQFRTNYSSATTLQYPSFSRKGQSEIILEQQNSKKNERDNIEQFETSQQLHNPGGITKLKKRKRKKGKKSKARRGRVLLKDKMFKNIPFEIKQLNPTNQRSFSTSSNTIKLSQPLELISNNTNSEIPSTQHYSKIQQRFKRPQSSNILSSTLSSQLKLKKIQQDELQIPALKWNRTLLERHSILKNNFVGNKEILKPKQSQKQNYNLLLLNRPQSAIVQPKSNSNFNNTSRDYSSSKKQENLDVILPKNSPTTIISPYALQVQSLKLGKSRRSNSLGRISSLGNNTPTASGDVLDWQKRKSTFELSFRRNHSQNVKINQEFFDSCDYMPALCGTPAPPPITALNMTARNPITERENLRNFEQKESIQKPIQSQLEENEKGNNTKSQEIIYESAQDILPIKKRRVTLSDTTINLANVRGSYLVKDKSKSPSVSLKKRRVFVMNSQDDFVRRALVRLGWQEQMKGISGSLLLSQQFDLKWIYKDSNEDYCNLQQSQFYNHFRNNTEMTAKGRLAANLKSLGESAQSFFPQCYDIGNSQERIAFAKDFNHRNLLILIKKHVKYFKLRRPKEMESIKMQHEYRVTISAKRNHSLSKKAVGVVVKRHNPLEFETIKTDLFFLTNTVILVEVIFLLRSLKVQQEKDGIHQTNQADHSDNAFGESLLFSSSSKNGNVNRNHQRFAWKLEDYGSPFSLFWKQIDAFARLNVPFDEEMGLFNRIPQMTKEFWATPSLYLMQKLYSLYRYFKKREPQSLLQGEKNIWIIKPSSNSKGQGIYLVDRMEDVIDSGLKLQARIVQKYIERPLIFSGESFQGLNGRKFDIRQWVLVSSLNPLRIYTFNNCYLRLCSSPYNLTELKDTSSHLTNYSLLKGSGNTVGDSNQPFSRKRMNTFAGENSVVELEVFMKYLYQYKSIDYMSQLKPRIERIIIDTVKCVSHKMEHRENSFELYGFDILIDEFVNPWLLEVNMSPACAERTPGLVKMLDAMALSMFEIVLRSKEEKAIGAMKENGNKSIDESFNTISGMKWEMIYEEIIQSTHKLSGRSSSLGSAARLLSLESISSQNAFQTELRESTSEPRQKSENKLKIRKKRVSSRRDCISGATLELNLYEKLEIQHVQQIQARKKAAVILKWRLKKISCRRERRALLMISRFVKEWLSRKRVEARAAMLKIESEAVTRIASVFRMRKCQSELSSLRLQQLRKRLICTLTAALYFSVKKQLLQRITAHGKKVLLVKRIARINRRVSFKRGFSQIASFAEVLYRKQLQAIYRENPEIKKRHILEKLIVIHQLRIDLKHSWVFFWNGWIVISFFKINILFDVHSIQKGRRFENIRSQALNIWGSLKAMLYEENYPPMKSIGFIVGSEQIMLSQFSLDDRFLAIDESREFEDSIGSERNKNRSKEIFKRFQNRKIGNSSNRLYQEGIGIRQQSQSYLHQTIFKTIKSNQK